MRSSGTSRGRSCRRWKFDNEMANFSTASNPLGDEMDVAPERVLIVRSQHYTHYKIHTPCTPLTHTMHAHMDTRHPHTQTMHTPPTHKTHTAHTRHKHHGILACFSHGPLACYPYGPIACFLHTPHGGR